LGKHPPVDVVIKQYGTPSDLFQFQIANLILHYLNWTHLFGDKWECSVMKIISVEQKEKVLACFRQKPVPSFTGISKQTGVPRVTIYHWFEQFEKGDLKWSEGGRRTSRHYLRQVREAMAQAYLEGNHTIGSLTASYGLRSESTVLNWVRDYKKAI